MTATKVLDNDDGNGIKDVIVTSRPPRYATNDDCEAPQSNGSGVLRTSSKLLLGGIVGVILVCCIP